MKRSIALGLIGSSAWLALACGGVEQTTLLDDAGNPIIGQDGGTRPDATTPPDDAAPTQDVIVPDDVTIVDVVTVDVPVGPPDSKIVCGTGPACDAKTQICCHHQFSTTQYQCVASVNDCMGTGDVPVSCSSDVNCPSQGNPSYVCCADIGGQGSGQCQGYAIATSVSCQASCTQQNQAPIGCDVQLQNCADPQQTCITSKCTLPGYGLCN